MQARRSRERPGPDRRQEAPPTPIRPTGSRSAQGIVEAEQNKWLGEVESFETSLLTLRSELGGQDQAIPAAAWNLAVTQPSNWMTPGLSWGSGGAADRLGHAATLSSI